jgi:hypothetical protein
MSYSVWWSGRDSLVDAACVSSQVGRWGSMTSHGGLDVGGRHSRTAANGMMCTRRRDDSARPANPRHQQAPAVEADRRRRRSSACRAAALAESGTRGADVSARVQVAEPTEHKAAVARRGTQACRPLATVACPGGSQLAAGRSTSEERSRRHLGGHPPVTRGCVLAGSGSVRQRISAV